MQQSPQHTITPRFGEWSSEAFTLFTKEWLAWVLMTAIYSVVVYTVAIVAIALPAVMLLGPLVRQLMEVTPTGSPAKPIIPAGTLGTAMLALLVGLAVTVVVNTYFLAGMTHAALKQLRGEAISVGEVFKGGNRLGTVVAVDLLWQLGGGLASLMCLLPGLIVASLWMYAHPLAVDRHLGPGECLRQSWERVRTHMWPYVGWAILIYLVMYAGSLVVVGALATIPIALLMWVVSYRDLFGVEAGGRARDIAAPEPTSGDPRLTSPL